MYARLEGIALGGLLYITVNLLSLPLQGRKLVALDS